MISFRSSAAATAAGLVMLATLLVPPTVRAEPRHTPRQLIDNLGVDIRQLLDSAKPERTPEDAERAVAAQIATLISTSPGHLSLTARSAAGRTPLMQAASAGYMHIVQALLLDPAVKLRINEPDEEGATAWMPASFAPSVTLVACNPGMLNAERYWLLLPYLKRMVPLLKDQGQALGAILGALEAAGAEADEERAKRLWLARCPNAAPELREALAGGPLMKTLINDALARQRNFNQAARESRKNVPAKPPEGMRFVHEPPGAQRSLLTNLLETEQGLCVRMSKPDLGGTINWSGDILLKVVAATRAGVVEAVDFEVIEGTKDFGVEDFFRQTVVRALANYHCKGEFIFEQEFQFRID